MLNHAQIFNSAMADYQGKVYRVDKVTGLFTIVYDKQNVASEFNNLFIAAPTMYVMLETQYEALKVMEAAHIKSGLADQAVHIAKLAESLRLTMVLATEGIDSATKNVDQYNMLDKLKTKGKAN